MKFGNGCWLQQEGIECFAAQEAYFITKKEQEVSFCVPTVSYTHLGSLTVTPTGGTGTKVGLSDPVVLSGNAIAQRIKATLGITGLSLRCV